MKATLVQNLKLFVASGAIALVASGCSGGGGAPPAAPGVALLNGVVSLTIPAKSTAATRRSVEFISSLATSVTIAVTGAPTVVADVSATSPNCVGTAGGRSCKIAITAPAGSDTFTVTIYGGAGGTGLVLGVGTSNVTVSASSFAVPVGIDGVPASLTITAGTTTFASGTAATTPITVTAIDADGTTPITGTYANPVTLSITGTSAGFTLTPSTVTASGQSVTLAYDGSPGVRTIGISGTANGIAAANVTPLSISVAPPLNIYVVNSDYGGTPSSLNVYPGTANGNAAPIRTITATSYLGTGIAVDGSGMSYVSGYASGTSIIDEFSPGANGNVAPTNVISEPSNYLNFGYNISGLALDGAGNLYGAVSSSGSPPLFVAVYPPGATGNASPSRTISLPVSQNAVLNVDPSGLAFDTAGNLYAVQNEDIFGGPYVAVYAPGASGNVAPIRTISGSNTGLYQPTYDAVDSSGRIYVTNLGTVTVYAAGANGNVAPIATIAGSKTGLAGNGLSYAGGIAVDSSGLIYVTTGVRQLNPSILVFAPGANGNVPPLRTITGSNTGLNYPVAIAVGP